MVQSLHDHSSASVIASAGKILLLGITLCVTASAQPQLRHGGEDKPPVMIGMQYDYTEGSHQGIIEAAILPLKISPSHIYQGSMFDVAAGVRTVNGRPGFRWKAMLFDMDGFTSGFFMKEWQIYRDNPLIPRSVPYGRFLFQPGLTVLEYDRTTLADTYARWLQPRMSLAMISPLSRFIDIEPRITVGAGLSSLRPGTVYAVGTDAETTFSGAEVKARASLAVRSKLWRDPVMMVTPEVEWRVLFAGSTIRFLSFGGTFTFIRNLTIYEEEPVNNRAHGIELFIRYERQIVSIGDRTVRLDHAQIGAQYCFGPGDL